MVLLFKLGWAEALPGKINFPLIDEPMLSYQIKRLKQAALEIL